MLENAIGLVIWFTWFDVDVFKVAQFFKSHLNGEKEKENKNKTATTTHACMSWFRDHTIWNGELTPHHTTLQCTHSMYHMRNYIGFCASHLDKTTGFVYSAQHKRLPIKLWRLPLFYELLLAKFCKQIGCIAINSRFWICGPSLHVSCTILMRWVWLCGIGHRWGFCNLQCVRSCNKWKWNWTLRQFTANGPEKTMWKRIRLVSFIAIYVRYK